MATAKITKQSDALRNAANRKANARRPRSNPVLDAQLESQQTSHGQPSQEARRQLSEKSFIVSFITIFLSFPEKGRKCISTDTRYKSRKEQASKLT